MKIDRSRAHLKPRSTPALTKRTGLTIPNNVSIEDWKEIGNRIFVLSNSSVWWLGDWLVYGQEHYPNRYRRAIEETSLDYQTLRNYAWIAKRYPLHRRRAKLSFQHHAELASLPDEQQDEWLSRAEKFGWSRNMLRNKLKASKSIEKQPDKPLKLQVQVAPEQQQRWQEAASAADQDLFSWMVLVLDGAANTTLEPAWDNVERNN
jgi:hypothetical protein